MDLKSMFYKLGKIKTNSGYIDVKRNIITGTLSYINSDGLKEDVKKVIDKLIKEFKKTFEVNEK